MNRVTWEEINLNIPMAQIIVNFGGEQEFFDLSELTNFVKSV